MTECPSCRTFDERQPRFCRKCGYQFASGPTIIRAPQPPFPQPVPVTPQRNGPPKYFALAVSSAILASVALLCYFGLSDAPPESRELMQHPNLPYRSPIQRKIKEATKYWEKEKRAEVAWPEQVRKAEVGVITTVVGPGASWPCASSKVALKELMKWYKASLAEPDSASNDVAFGRLGDALMRTKSIMVEPRDRVKILSKEPGMRKISVIQPHRGTYGSGYMLITSHGCWVASDAVTR